MNALGKPEFIDSPAGSIPLDWKFTTLGEVITFRGGSAFKEKYQGKVIGDLPFIKVSDFNLLGNEKFIRHANHWITEQDNKIIKATLFEAGSIVFAKVGAALLSNRRRILTRKTAIDNNLMAATPIGIDGIFSYYHLQTVDFGKLVQAGAVPSINQGQLQELPIAVPPHLEQKKIAAILTTVDEKLDVIARQIAEIKNLKQGLMQTLFSRGIGTQNFDGRWIPHSDFKDSKIGKIPATWSANPLRKLAKESRLRNFGAIDDNLLCGVLKTVGLVPMRERVKGISTERCRIVEPNGFAYNPMRINIGSIARNLDNKPVMVSPDYVVFSTVATQMSSDYLDHFRRSDRWARFVGRTGDGGVRIRIYFDDLAELIVPTPPLSEQCRIAEILDTTNAKIELLLAKEFNYQGLKRGLMQKLLTGAWRVKPDAQISESASSIPALTNGTRASSTTCQKIEEFI